MERRTSGHPFEKIGKMELGGKTHDRGNLADVLIRIAQIPFCAFHPELIQKVFCRKPRHPPDQYGKMISRIMTCLRSLCHRKGTALLFFKDVINSGKRSGVALRMLKQSGDNPRQIIFHQNLIAILRKDDRAFRNSEKTGGKGGFKNGLCRVNDSTGEIIRRNVEERRENRLFHIKFIAERKILLRIFESMRGSRRHKQQIILLDGATAVLRNEFAFSRQDDQRWQHAIYLQRRSYYKERMNYFKQEIERCKAQQETTRESHKTQTGRLKAIKQIEDIIADLQKKRVASIKEELEISISRMQMEVEVDRLRNNLKELEHEEQSVIASRNSFMEEWRKAISEEMVKVRRELTSTLMEYQKQRQLATYVYLRAPCEAVVHEIASFSEGSAVREAEALVTLVPIDAGIELEAEIAPKDIGRIHKGAQARIKLNSFPFQKHGTLEGEVVDISEDTLQKQEQGGNRAYYRAKMTVSGKLKNITEKFRLIPGMETQCEIKVGRRRVIEYIIHPLIKSLDEAIREP